MTTTERMGRAWAIMSPPPAAMGRQAAACLRLAAAASVALSAAATAADKLFPPYFIILFSLAQPMPPLTSAASISTPIAGCVRHNGGR